MNNLLSEKELLGKYNKKIAILNLKINQVYIDKLFKKIKYLYFTGRYNTLIISRFLNLKDKDIGNLSGYLFECLFAYDYESNSYELKPEQKNKCIDFVFNNKIQINYEVTKLGFNYSKSIINEGNIAGCKTEKYLISGDRTGKDYEKIVDRIIEKVDKHVETKKYYIVVVFISSFNISMSDKKDLEDISKMALSLDEISKKVHAIMYVKDGASGVGIYNVTNMFNSENMYCIAKNPKNDMITDNEFKNKLLSNVEFLKYWDK